MKRSLFSILAALFLMLPTLAWAQSGSVKSMDELMQEVEEETGDDDSKESDGSDEAPSGGDSDGSVKSMDQLMQEVEDETGLRGPGSKADSESDSESADSDADEAAAPVASENSNDSGDQAAAADEDAGSSWFTLGLVALILSMVLLGVPLYVLIGLVAAYLLVFGSTQKAFGDLTIIIEQTRGLADEPVLLAIPFFVVSGAIMTEGDIAQRLIDVAEAVFGQLPGGLAISTVFACAIFAAISGSSPVTVIAIGTIMYPVLVENGYPEKFSCGLVTSAGSLGILIPPSIPMIVYGIVDPTGLRDPEGYDVVGGDGSVADLFIAGVGPGLLIGLVMSGYALTVGFRAGVSTSDFEAKKLLRALRRGIWALFLPILILGGIYTGVFTATQAAAVSVIYAVVVEFFIHRSIKLEDMPRVLTESSVLMGSILIIMALALGFNRYLVEAKIPDQAAQAIMAMDLGILEFLLILNVMLLVVGFFMDILSAILILVPLLAGIGLELGIHPVHLAIIFIVNLEIGYLTPPIGINLFVSGALFEKGLGDVIKSVIPFMLLMLGCLMVVTYVPTVSLGLVSLSKGKSFVVDFPEPAAETPAETAPKEPEAGFEASGADETADETDAPEKPADVKSMDELMQEVESEESGKSGETSDDSRNGSEPNRVKSMEELMQEVESEDPGSPPD